MQNLTPHPIKQRLQLLEKRVAIAVCSVDGVVAREEIEELERLRLICGERFDAINFKWVPLSSLSVPLY